MKLHLVTDDTPSGYALNAVLKNTGWFEDTRVDPYGEPFPLLDDKTIIIGNFAQDPKSDAPMPENYWYFPSYAPKVSNSHVYFSPKTTSYLMMYAIIKKLVPDKQDSTLSSLITALNAYSGKGLYYLDPQYDFLMKTMEKVLAYTNLYKTQTDVKAIKSYLEVGKAPDEDTEFLVNNTVFNNARYTEERLAHTLTFNTKLGSSVLSVGVVHADQNLGLIANEMAKRMVAKGAKNYMAMVYKNNYIMVTSNVFEELVPMFGEHFSYQGGQGTYSFFMDGLTDNTLYRALKQMFKEGSN